jgi:hypothetical protein
MRAMRATAPLRNVGLGAGGSADRAGGPMDFMMAMSLF